MRHCIAYVTSLVPNNTAGERQGLPTLILPYFLKNLKKFRRHGRSGWSICRMAGRWGGDRDEPA
jgi:hypothetical protein